MKAAEMKERPIFTLMKQTDVQSIYPVSYTHLRAHET